MIALFTNVTWDLFVAERDSAFDGQMRVDRGHARVHPAAPGDRSRRARAPRGDRTEVSHARTHRPPDRRKRSLLFPDNLRMIGPESTISSDVLRAMASLNLVYCASVGLEAIIAGQPVLICGNPYYARKGFTIDVESPDTLRAASGGACRRDPAYSASWERGARPTIPVPVQIPLWDADGADHRSRDRNRPEDSRASTDCNLACRSHWTRPAMAFSTAMRFFSLVRVSGRFRRPRRAGGGSSFFLYHRIASPREDPFALAVPENWFQDHLEILRSHCRLVSLDEILGNGPRARLAWPRSPSTMGIPTI